MPQTWQPGRSGARDLNRWITQNGGKGVTVYTISKQALNAAPWEDAKMFNSRTVDGRSLVSGEWMTGHLSISGLLAQEGTVYAEPLRGMRELGSPGRQVAGPMGHGDYSAYLDEAEIRSLGKRVQNGSDPATRPSRGERGRRR
ncbi:hypothetical protein [Streptomyces sp. NPDC001492]